MSEHDKPDQSGIEKMPTGIEGVDEITGGGLPRCRTTLVMGGPGSGKTVFALETLVNGAREWGEPGIFVAFEENSRHIIQNAASFGWNLPELEKEKLFFLNARFPVDTVLAGGYDLAGMLASIEAKAQEMGAKRVVFDSIDVLLSLLDDPRAERTELYRLHDWLAAGDLTGLITTRIEDADQRHAEEYGFLQYMADAVLKLTHDVEDRISTRGFRVVKYRGSAFAENEFPLVISERGIEVASIGITRRQVEYPVSTERISTGVERLDTMMNGGYVRGTSILVTGAPGTAKSTLAGSFTRAACERSERALYISFDESPQEIIRNFASVNIKLAPYVESGLLHMESYRTDARSAEEHLMRMRALIEEHQPRCMVIDPLSAIVKAGGPLAALGVAVRLLHLAKLHGITLFSTSLIEGTEPLAEATPIHISTVADTWIHVSYMVQGGERNRALTIVKARGTKHSAQVRELVLSDEGVTLTNVYTASGMVLMGTLRREKEQQDAYARQQASQEIERKQREFELAEMEATSRIEAMQRELELKRKELDVLRDQYTTRETQLSEQKEGRRQLRGMDNTAASSPSAVAPDTRSTRQEGA